MASDKMLGSFDQKSAPEDNDLLVEYDAAASKVKNVKFGGVWNWIVKKLTSAVINELQTSSKNVVGAINELNSKTQMSVYCKTDLLIYAESLYTGRYFFNITNETKNSPCDYGFCIIYIVNRDRKIIVYDKTTNNVYVNTRMDSGTAWIRWRKA